MEDLNNFEEPFQKKIQELNQNNIILEPSQNNFQEQTNNPIPYQEIFPGPHQNDSPEPLQNDLNKRISFNKEIK